MAPLTRSSAAHFRKRRTLSVLAALALAAAPGAQTAFLPAGQPAPGAKGVEAPPSLALRSYSVSESRRAFAMCDLNRDDLITMREARRTIVNVQTFAEFRLFDEDSNGAVYFDEFDSRFRHFTRNGGALVLLGEAAVRRIRPDPISRMNEVELQTSRIFRDRDTDGDGRISKAEWNAFAASFGSPVEGQRIFEELDLDQSADLTLGELLPLAGRFWPIRPKLPEPKVDEVDGRPSRLPDHLALADTDGDQYLAEREIRYSLLRLNPRLERFVDEIVEGADVSGDRRVSAREALRIGSQD